MKIDLLEAGERDFPIIKKMSLFYAYEMSGACGWELKRDGSVDHPFELPEYWQAQNKRTPAEYRWTDLAEKGLPFLVKVNKELAGFALVKRKERGPPPLYDMGHFFVWRKYQRQGIGCQVAHALFARLPGYWQVCQMFENQPAQAFWHYTIGAYTDGDYSEDLWEGMLRQRFEARTDQV